MNFRSDLWVRAWWNWRIQKSERQQNWDMLVLTVNRVWEMTSKWRWYFSVCVWMHKYINFSIVIFVVLYYGSCSCGYLFCVNGWDQIKTISRLYWSIFTPTRPTFYFSSTLLTIIIFLDIKIKQIYLIGSWLLFKFLSVSYLTANYLYVFTCICESRHQQQTVVKDTNYSDRPITGTGSKPPTVQAHQGPSER